MTLAEFERQVYAVASSLPICGFPLSDNRAAPWTLM
jgi:hypothetical protein